MSEVETTEEVIAPEVAETLEVLEQLDVATSIGESAWEEPASEDNLVVNIEEVVSE